MGHNFRVGRSCSRILSLTILDFFEYFMIIRLLGRGKLGNGGAQKRDRGKQK